MNTQWHSVTGLMSVQQYNTIKKYKSQVGFMSSFMKIKGRQLKNDNLAIFGPPDPPSPLNNCTLMFKTNIFTQLSNWQINYRVLSFVFFPYKYILKVWVPSVLFKLIHHEHAWYPCERLYCDGSLLCSTIRRKTEALQMFVEAPESPPTRCDIQKSHSYSLNESWAALNNPCSLANEAFWPFHCSSPPLS